VLEVPALPADATPENIEACLPTFNALRQRGFRLAFDQNLLRRNYASWLPMASFVKLDMQSFGLEHAEKLVKFAQTYTRAQIVAEKVETAEQFEHMLGLGIKLFQGYWFAQPQVVQARTIRPTHATIIQLINLVRQQASTEEIEELLKKDPTLSFNLLRFINSSGFGLSCEVTSFRHAVMILGLKKLFRWAAMLLTAAREGGPPPAVGQTAVIRGRLMELLSAELLPPVALPQSVVDALVHNKGVFAPFLDLTRACESGDEAAFAQAANALHLSNHQVNWAHLQALSWADSLISEGA
ncbi:MAG: HDOD domain-containing protein, partial [Comamonas sp.]